MLRALLSDEKGRAVEYAVLVGFIAAVLIGTASLVGKQLGSGLQGALARATGASSTSVAVSQPGIGERDDPDHTASIPSRAPGKK
jgi:Flp pilus assembly pilin Flp